MGCNEEYANCSLKCAIMGHDWPSADYSGSGHEYPSKYETCRRCGITREVIGYRSEKSRRLQPVGGHCAGGSRWDD